MALRVIITGASGVLGSAVRNAFLQNPDRYELLSLSHSRSGDGLLPLDLTNQEEVQRVFMEFQPKWVIHCAAERRPDIAEKDPAGTQVLNAQVPNHLATLSKSLEFTLVYISTDYVFDGTSPPYTPSCPTNPLQLYGQSKRDGETAVLGVDGASVVVLRVPVLYGPAPKNSDSAINILLDIVQDQTGTTYKMDHYATRYPTNVVDVANFIIRLTEYNNRIPPILHYSGAEPYTKYEICLVFASILVLPHAHITPDADPPTGAGATTRPRDCHLDTKETEELGIMDDGDGGPLGLSLFEEWWSGYLKSSSCVSKR